MSEENSPHRKGKISGTMWAGAVLVLIGIIIGAYFSPAIEPFVNPQRAALVESAQAIRAQNALLKQQIDCLVNGINQNKGKAAVNECT